MPSHKQQSLLSFQVCIIGEAPPRQSSTKLVVLLNQAMQNALQDGTNVVMNWEKIEKVRSFGLKTVTI
ncbi:hypothetical protein SLA2020_099800 [Shorea laevis]